MGRDVQVRLFFFYFLFYFILFFEAGFEILILLLHLQTVEITGQSHQIGLKKNAPDH